MMCRKTLIVLRPTQETEFAAHSEQSKKRTGDMIQKEANLNGVGKVEFRLESFR